LSHFDKGGEGTGVLSSNVHGEASPVDITCGHFDMKEVRMMMIEPEDKTLNKCIIFILSTFLIMLTVVNPYVDKEEAVSFDEGLEPMEKKYLPCQEEFYIMSNSIIR
jgi:hypothetical protein